MVTKDWEFYARCSRLKTKRKKKRLQKTDADKKLIQLSRELTKIHIEMENLGYQELKPPVQRGWKRTFVLRFDVKAGKEALFFQTLLDKINTVEYSHRKDFRVKKNKQGKRVYLEQIQKLRALSELSFSDNLLSEIEKTHFREEWKVCKYNGRIIKYYFIKEPWRFVLKVKPNMITKVRIIDPLLLQREAEIKDYLNVGNRDSKLYKLTKGRKQNRYIFSRRAKKYKLLKSNTIGKLTDEYYY